MLDLLSNQKSLRPHQAKAIEMLRHSLGMGNRRVVVQMPTGAGKTITASEIIKGALAKGNDVIFTAPAVSLIDQTVLSFMGQGINDIGVIQASHQLTNPLARVQVATVQSLARREIPAATLVIVDECHVSAPVIDRMMAERDDVFFVGLSATPWRAGMGKQWQDLVIPVTIGEMIASGLLSEFVAYAPDVPDLSGVKVRAGEFVEDDLRRVMGDAKILGSVVGTWLERGERRPTLCFCVNRAHAAQVQNEFLANGVSAAYVDGKTDSVERGLINRRFREGEYAVICSVRTMTTGVDLPVSCIIDAAPTKSEMLHVQKIGRGLRVNPGTEDCLILDHAGNSLRLGLVTDIHHATLSTGEEAGKRERKASAEKLPKECSKCGVLHVGRLCPSCGHEVKPPKLEEASGDLVQLSGKRKVHTSAEKQAWWSGLMHIKNAKGRSRGWASHTYRDKFGVWPKGLDDTPLPATTEMWNFVKSKDIRFAKRRAV